MTREDFDAKLAAFLVHFKSVDPYLVGSAARACLAIGKASFKNLEDIDILIPLVFSSKLVDILSKEDFFKFVKRTGFGDFKIGFEGVEWDLIRKDVATYLIKVPTAFDGVAIHLETRAVLMTAECASGANSEITNRPTFKPNYIPYYEAHLRKQGL